MGVICADEGKKHRKFIINNRFEREHLYRLKSFFFEINNNEGIGYFIVSTKRIYFVTNYSIIPQKKVDLKETIFINNNSEKKFKIKLDIEERFIKRFESPIDLTFIEIKYSDSFHKLENNFISDF